MTDPLPAAACSAATPGRPTARAKVQATALEARPNFHCKNLIALPR